MQRTDSQEVQHRRQARTRQERRRPAPAHTRQRDEIDHHAHWAKGPCPVALPRCAPASGLRRILPPVLVPLLLLLAVQPVAGTAGALSLGLRVGAMPLAETYCSMSAGTPARTAWPLVSVIIPCHNAMPWLEECLASCATQDYAGPLEVSIFDDSSSDGSQACIRAWAEKLQDAGIKCVCHGNRWPESASSDANAPAGGAGKARNQAVAQSSGVYLCFMDADDAMLPHRVRRQLEAAMLHPCAIIGGRECIQRYVYICICI